jgi:Transposase, Mutator family
VPTSKVKEVAAMLKAIHAQEDRAAARQKAEQVAAKLKDMKLADAAEHVRTGIAETLHYYAFPREHWRCLRTNNPLERLLREVRRRTRAVEAFPDGKSALMLAAARLRHVAGAKRAKRPEYARKNLRLPLGGAEHHRIYASTNVRKTLDTTVADNQANYAFEVFGIWKTKAQWERGKEFQTLPE